MPRNSEGAVLSHWHESFEDFSTSTQDFYAAVEEAIRRRNIPGIEVSRVLFHEGGRWTPKREYLRIRQGRIVFDICSARYGTSHFFSWWVVKLPARYGLLFVTAITTTLCYFLWKLVIPQLLNIPSDSLLSLASPLLRAALFPFTFLFGMPAILFLLGLGVQEGLIGDDEWVLSTPVIGPLYNKVFKPLTYYRIDTAHMFRDSIGAVVGEAINNVRGEKGLRLLESEELEPSVPEEIAS